MKKVWKIMAVAAISLAGFTANAQTGYYVLSGSDLKGNPGGVNKDADNLFNNGSWTDVIMGNATDLEKFSAKQTMPFTFKFNDVAVTDYYISSTGFITFGDTTGKKSSLTPNNEALPSALLPDKTITFWGMSGKKCAAVSQNYGTVRTKVVGTAPNRQLYINYFAVTNPADNNSIGFFAIVLEETTNRIYLVDQWKLQIQGATYVDPGFTLGVQIDGSTAVTLPSGNNYKLTSAESANEDNIYAVFIPGTQPANDAKLVEVELPKQLKKDESTILTAKLFNTGSNVINTADFNYQINSGNVVTASLSGLNIASAGTKSINHTTPIVGTTGGEELTVKTWFTNINGQSINTDTIVRIAKVVLGVSGTKKVLLEEFSTAPCQYCPDGAVVLEDIEAFYGDDIIIAQHHAGFGTDKMTIPEHSAYATAYAPGAPTATVDRKMFVGQTSVGISRNIWEDKAVEQLEDLTPFDIALTHTYDSASRKITMNVSVDVLDFVSNEDYRVNIFIIEDSVAHKGLSGYDQVNYYNTVAGHPYQGAGNPIKGYVHRKVVRAVPTTTWGDASIFNGSIEPGAKFTKTYTYTIPAKYDVLAPNLNDMGIVAFVSKYDANDVTKHYVYNANRIDFDPGFEPSTSVQTVVGKFETAKVYPNPVTKASVLEFEASENVNTTLEVFDVTGKMVFARDLGLVNAGNNKIALEELHSVLSSGVYMLNIKGGNSLIQAKITVNN